MSVKTMWADRDGEAPTIHGPYDGLLLIMNVGLDSVKKDPLPYDYERALMEAIGMAHASGWAVIYAFDMGAEQAPEYFDFIEGMDHLRLMGETCKRAEANFSGVPSRRTQEFKAMAQAVFDKSDTFKFTQRIGRIAGKCKIEGIETFLPVTGLAF